MSERTLPDILKMELSDVLQDVKAKAWNQAIAPRVPQLLSFLKSDEWISGLGAWLRFQEGELDRKLRFGCKTRDEDQFVRGQLAVMSEILDLQTRLETMQTLNEQKKKQADSRGVAGY